MVVVHLGDEAEADFLGADGFAGAGGGAVAEAFRVHLTSRQSLGSRGRTPSQGWSAPAPQFPSIGPNAHFAFLRDGGQLCLLEA
jgi:hypothetical protein